MDKEIEKNIAAQDLRARRLKKEAEDLAQGVEALEERMETPPRADKPQRESVAAARVTRPDLPLYQTLTKMNEEFLAKEAIDDVTFDDLLTVEEIDALEELTEPGSEPWTASDFVAVGLCGAIGVFATLWDEQIDAVVHSGLGLMRNTAWLGDWEQDAKHLPIDYTGPGFGGPGHRVRSPGHDLGRPFAALDQIRRGEFRGWYWDYGERKQQIVGGFSPVPDVGLASVLWLKHLLTDFVTTTSLPLPWWSHLYELSARDLRKLAHDLYNPSNGYGINMRSMILSKAFPVVTTELIVRAKLHLDAYQRDGRFDLTSHERQKRDEMLFAAHGITGAAAVGRVVFGCLSEGPIGLRHLNMHALLRTGVLGARLLADRRRSGRPRLPEWDEMLRNSFLPWEIDEIATIETATV